MRVRASSTTALVVSLLVNDALAGVHRRHEQFHRKRAEVTVTDDIVEMFTEIIRVTVDWPNGKTVGIEYPSDYSPPATSTPAQVSAIPQPTSAASPVTDTYVAPTSSQVNIPSGAQFVTQPQQTSTPPAAPPAPPTTMTTVVKPASTPAAAVSTPASSPAPGGGQPTYSSKKRGLAYNDASLTQYFTGANSDVSWAYNWGQTTSGLASGLEYIPLLWNGDSSRTTPWPAVASAAIASGSKHLFSFNEPDLGSQANMSPQDAAQAYMSYMQPFAGKAQLGAPAVTNGGGATGLTWLGNFMSACTGCTIDFVNIHWYDSATNFAYFKSHVEQAYATGGNRPVWITEFAASGSLNDQNAFLEVVIPWLDAQPYVQGYAYFMCSDGVLVSGNGPSTLGNTFMSYTSSTISPLIANA